MHTPLPTLPPQAFPHLASKSESSRSVELLCAVDAACTNGVHPWRDAGTRAPPRPPFTLRALLAGAPQGGPGFADSSDRDMANADRDMVKSRSWLAEKA